MLQVKSNPTLTPPRCAFVYDLHLRCRRLPGYPRFGGDFPMRPAACYAGPRASSYVALLDQLVVATVLGCQCVVARVVRPRR